MRRLLAALVALASLGAAAPAFAYDEPELRAKLVREMRLAGPASGAYVRDLDSGQELFALRENRALVPASVEKLYTTAGALLRLGPAETLKTVAATDGVVDEAGVLRGDLYLLGGGDPFFGAEAASRLARAVRAAGIVRIAGGVVGDEDLFDARRSVRVTGYDFDLGGVLSALSYDGGLSRGRPQLNAARFAAERFTAQLRAADVTSGRRGRAGAAPEGALPLAEVASLPLGMIARAVNVPSNNFAAEMLLKGLGARVGGRGSTGAGAAVVRDTLDDFGVRPRVVDGSGLSRANRTTARQVVRLLERMDGQDVAVSFRTSLAVAGQTGTLRRRMRGTPAAGRCRAKTGTLRTVSALAGYCATRGGRDIAFAMIMNAANPFGARRVQDRITAAIARLEGAPSAVPADPGGTGVPAAP